MKAQSIARLAPGLLLVAFLATLAMSLASIEGLASYGIGALTLAIVVGMLLGNAGYHYLAEYFASGINFAKQRLLRLGILLYGLRLSFDDLAHVGMQVVLVDAIIVASTFTIAYFAGTRLFRLDRQITILIGAGSSICGAAAVLATDPVIRAREEQVPIAVATVVVFGTVGLFVYPAIYAWLTSIPALAISPLQYGVYAGSTIHEVAQVVAVGYSMNNEAADAAVIAKMIRVLLLAPFLLFLSMWLAGRSSSGKRAQPSDKGIVVVPWFVVGFAAFSVLNSVVDLPKPFLKAINTFDTAILAMSMSGLGLTTQFSAIRRAGTRPLALAALLFVWLVVGGFAINRLLVNS